MSTGPLVRLPPRLPLHPNDPWTAMIDFLRQAGVGTRTFNDYQHLPLQGHGTLMFSEPLERYFSSSLKALSEQRQLSTIRVRYIATNFDHIAQHLGWERPVANPEPSFEVALRTVGVPDNYPVVGCFFAIGRVENCAQEAGIVTLAELCERGVSDPSLASMRRKSQRTFGKKSIKALTEFVSTVRNGDQARVRDVVPLLRNATGVDLGLLVKRFFANSSIVQQSHLYERLVGGKTLDDVARGLEVSHETVRLVQEKLFTLIRAVIESDPELRAGFMRQWATAGAVRICSDCDSEEAEIAAAAIAQLLDEDPANEARRRVFDEACDRLLNEIEGLVDYHFGCLDLRRHLQRNAEVSLEYVVRWSSSHQQFDFDPATGFARVRSPSLRLAIAALIRSGKRSIYELAQEVRRVPGLPPISTVAMETQIAYWRQKLGPVPWDSVEFSAAPMPMFDQDATVDHGLAGANSIEPKRTIVRTVIGRDPELARQVKQENAYRCQICSLHIALPDNQGLYAESHHIIPLGQPHYGEDERWNLLCVCPYHHVLLDYGVIALDKSQLKGTSAAIANSALAYHNERIYGRRRTGAEIDRESAVLTERE